MRNATTLKPLLDAATAYFLPELFRTEDFDAFELGVSAGMRSVGAKCVQHSLEAFDASLRASLPRGWTLHETAARTLVTLLGEVTYRRSIYIDRFGRRRAWADELLGIPKRRRLSAGAFLWVVERASELSYRKTARAFEAETGARISHVTVMNCVHEEGRMLAGAAPVGEGLSCERVFVEADGLYLHLQCAEHRKEALPRQLYEQARRTVSFELKMACMYAGKRRVANGRYERGNLSVVVADADPESFWARVASQLAADYDLGDAAEVWAGHDGGQWCGPGRLAEAVPEGTAVISSLDPFHVLKRITRAYPEGAKRDWAAALAYRGKGKQLGRMASRIAESMPAGRSRDRVRELASYASGNARDVRFPRPALGTMEGTNFHVGARRCKNNGTSWSRRGAEAMCAVRAALFTGKPLLKPDKHQLFTEEEKAAEEDFLGHFNAASVPCSVGRGWEPANAGVAIPKAAAISVARRS